MLLLEQKRRLIDFWRDNFPFTRRELDAFRDVCREDFVPESVRDQAYDDHPLPLVRGKTISQPTTVMIMTHALGVQPTDVVFEVGTGSGFQAAILSRLADKVYSAEVIPELVQFAKNNLKKSNIGNVEVIEEDGAQGFRQHAPFDKIMLTAACREFPRELVKQLKTGGKIAAPVGTREEQELMVGTKKPDGEIELELLGPFLFTPMYGKYGFLR